MNPRHRRLLSDLREMEKLAEGGTVGFRTEGNPPELYHLMFTGGGLALDADRRVVVRRLHRCDAYLHTDYPRRPPVVTWLTPIFHPNILGPDRNGGVCIGSWSASESLADLSLRLQKLVTYHAFNSSDALNITAASWLRQSGISAGCDLASLVGRTVEEPPLDVAVRSV